MNVAASAAVSASPTRHLAGDVRALARLLDREADALLFLGQRRAAERLAQRAETLREGLS